MHSLDGDLLWLYSSNDKTYVVFACRWDTMMRNGKEWFVSGSHVYFADLRAGEEEN